MNTIISIIFTVITLCTSLNATATAANVADAAVTAAEAMASVTESVQAASDMNETVFAATADDAALAVIPDNNASGDRLVDIVKDDVPLAMVPVSEDEPEGSDEDVVDVSADEQDTDAAEDESDDCQGPECTGIVRIVDPVGFPCCTTVEIADGWATITNTHDGYFVQTIVTESDFYLPGFAQTFTWN